MTREEFQFTRDQAPSALRRSLVALPGGPARGHYATYVRRATTQTPSAGFPSPPPAGREYDSELALNPYESLTPAYPLARP
jgi:hypothetical protein